MERGDLPTELTSNTATRTSDHYHSTLDDLANVFWFQPDWLAIKEILDFDIAELAYADTAHGQLVERWNRLEL